MSCNYLQSEDAGSCWEFLLEESCIILVYDAGIESSLSELFQVRLPAYVREEKRLVILVENQREGEGQDGQKEPEDLMSNLSANKFLSGNVENLDLSWILYEIIERHLDSIGDVVRRHADLSMSLLQSTFKGILALPIADRQAFEVFLSEKVSQKEGMINHEGMLKKWLDAYNGQTSGGNPPLNGPPFEERAISSEGALDSDPPAQVPSVSVPPAAQNVPPPPQPTVNPPREIRRNPPRNGPRAEEGASGSEGAADGGTFETAGGTTPQNNTSGSGPVEAAQENVHPDGLPPPPQPTVPPPQTNRSVNPRRQRRRNPEGASQSEVAEDESEGAEDDDIPHSPLLDQPVEVEAAQNELPPPQVERRHSSRVRRNRSATATNPPSTVAAQVRAPRRAVRLLRSEEEIEANNAPEERGARGHVSEEDKAREVVKKILKTLATISTTAVMERVTNMTDRMMERLTNVIMSCVSQYKASFVKRIKR